MMPFDAAIRLTIGGAAVVAAILFLAILLADRRDNRMKAKIRTHPEPYRTGFFVTFEGIDGTGKTTQIQRLRQTFEERFESLKDQVVLVKEPGDMVDGKYIGSELGIKVREILFFDPVLKSSTGVLDEEARDLLFLADHIQLWKKTITPALKANKVVLCDRYADSQFAYGPGKNASPWLQTLYAQRYGPVPDVIVLLTGDPEELVSRTKRVGSEAGKQDGKSWAAVDRQALIQNAYLHLIAGRPNTVVVNVDHKDIDQVANEIWMNVSARYTAKWEKKQKPEQLELHPNSQADGHYA
jgi:dTMP kinase